MLCIVSYKTSSHLCILLDIRLYYNEYVSKAIKVLTCLLLYNMPLI